MNSKDACRLMIQAMRTPLLPQDDNLELYQWILLAQIAVADNVGLSAGETVMVDAITMMYNGSPGLDLIQLFLLDSAHVQLVLLCYILTYVSLNDIERPAYLSRLTDVRFKLGL